MNNPAEFQYDMGYTVAEFTKVLTGSFTGENSPLSCKSTIKNSWLISHIDSAMGIEILIKERPPRILGAISLPVLLVTFKVNSATTEQIDFFFDKFFKYFHKGGG